MFEQFRNNFRFSDDKWNDYSSRFKRMVVPAKTILLKEGEVSKKMFLVEKGCVRVGFNNNGTDLTFQFFFENSTVASLESFKKQLPSQLFIETIEPSVLWYVNKKDVDIIIAEINEIPVMREKFLDVVFERTFDYMKHFLSFIKDTPSQRYVNLVKDNPQIIKRVPQHYIASYLGITTVHLSRIKSKLAKGKR
ncbi:MAG TPA: Crp/Fnr family transcriptional regulator [Hanamia sp.]